MAEWAGDLEIPALRAAVEVMDLLVGFWAGPQCSCEVGTYAPDKVRAYVKHWEELSAACEGLSASSASPLSRAGERDARRTLVAIRADLMAGTDRALGRSPAYAWWNATRRVYQAQQRTIDLYRHRRGIPRLASSGEPERAVADGVIYEAIARSLGWYPHEC